MFEPGMIIQNRYEIAEEIGAGGMSVVYKAMDHVLNRYVAMKVLKIEFSDDKNFVSKFRMEAQSAAGLSHPNIVNVFDVGEESGYYYIVMELVEGITLKEYIQQNGRLNYATALDFIIQICSGIEVAHEHHTIHRDIKPQNIIVSKNGTLKVTDFGIAKAATSNTIASTAMGSVHYISPEQARGGFSDERSDIYSLGITLYEMLTGRVPFEGENNVTVALMHIQSEIIPPREYYPDIPVGLEKIVLKATQKRPEQRYLTTNALLADLKKIAMDPNAQVGIASTVISNDAPTIQISADELTAIKNASAVSQTVSAKGPTVFPVNQKNSELEDAKEALQSLYDDEPFEYDSDEDEDEKPLFDDTEDKDDTEEIDSKIEKMITIGAIVATAIIGIIIIIAFFSITGVFKKNEKATTTEIPTTITTEEIIKMPDLVGYDADEATKQLDDLGIAYIIERDYSDRFEEGKVASQSIDYNTEIKDSDRVTLVISKGLKKDAIPDVTGKTSDEAKSILEAAGFTVDEDDEYSDEVDENYVISQSPEAGSQAAEGTSVKIVISKGKEVKVAKVPDLKKKTVTEAENALTEVNLKLGNVSQEYSDSVDEGKVISQSIAADTEVKEETKIDITISKGKKPVQTKYSASFSGTISNSSYEFPEGNLVKITVTLKVGDTTYPIINDWYDEASLPIDGSSLAPYELTSKDNISLLYSVQDDAGNDVTACFTSTLQAKLKTVEQ